MAKLLPVLTRGPAARRYTPLLFVSAAMDAISPAKAATAATSAGIPTDLISYKSIPRAREVGQSWLTTPLTTLLAFRACVSLVLHSRPDVIFCNGPGGCPPPRPSPSPLCVCVCVLVRLPCISRLTF